MLSDTPPRASYAFITEYVQLFMPSICRKEPAWRLATMVGEENQQPRGVPSSGRDGSACLPGPPTAHAAPTSDAPNSSRFKKL